MVIPFQARKQERKRYASPLGRRRDKMIEKRDKAPKADEKLSCITRLVRYLGFTFAELVAGLDQQAQYNLD